jgi:hypothetical protein
VRPAGTGNGNIVCESIAACFDDDFSPLPGGTLVDAAGTGSEPWRPDVDYLGALRIGPADVGAIELAP